MIRRGEDAAKIADDGVFVIPLPGESFRDSAYYKGFMKRPVGLSKQLKYNNCR